MGMYTQVRGWLNIDDYVSLNIFLNVMGMKNYDE